MRLDKHSQKSVWVRKKTKVSKILGNPNMKREEEEKERVEWRKPQRLSAGVG